MVQAAASGFKTGQWVTTDFGVGSSTCQPDRELIQQALEFCPTRCRSGGNWPIRTASPAPRNASNDSFANSSARTRWKRAPLSSPHPAKKRRWTTAKGLWCAPKSGKHRGPRLVVLTLGYSRKCIGLLNQIICVTSIPADRQRRNPLQEVGENSQEFAKKLDRPRGFPRYDTRVRSSKKSPRGQMLRQNIPLQDSGRHG